MITKVKLSDIVKVAGRVGWKGYTVDDLREDGPWVIGANDITSDHRLDLSKAKHISREKFEESPEIIIEVNDILIVKVGSTIGKVAIVKNDIGEACINPNSVILKKCKINPSYLYYYFVSSAGQAFLKNNSSASAQSALNQTTLKEMLFDIVDRKSQDIIANLLDSINLKILLNNKINAELTAMAKTLYDYWFVQFDFPNTTGKPYKTSGGTMVWNAELKREIPKDWEVGNIMTLANLLGGGTPKTDNPNYWNGDIPFFTPADAEDSIYSTSTKQNITEIGLKSSSTKRYSKGTVFITARGTVGKINIASRDMSMNQSCYALQGKENINSQFLYFYTNELVHYIKSKASGSIFKALVTNDFKFTKMIVPPISQIQNYGIYSKSIFDKVLNNNLENQELASLRDWLLPMLMNGQVSVG